MPWNKEDICRIAALTEFKNGMYVNLGIGMPTAVPNYIPEEMQVVFQSENGMLGMGPFPYAGEEDPDLINAGKQTISILSSSSFFDSAESFAMIRGGHMDLTILGALEVDETGSLANWMIPGKMVKGMGGAMDLVAGVRRIVILMDHVAKDGSPKLVKKCSLPLTGVNVVQRVITDLCVFDIKDKMYYRKTSSARNYSNTPSGTMYVERLIASKPCFSSAIQQGEQEKKSLVLADWTSPTWSKDKCKQVQKTLRDLIDDGFALYSWQNGRVIPINKNHLLTMSFLDGMTPASEQEVTNAAIIQKENKLTKEQVMVIDNYCLNSLINNTETKEPRTIRTSEIPSDWSDQTLEKMITLLTTSKPKLEEIILDEFSYEKSRINCILKDKFKNVKFKEDYQVFDNFRINDEKAQIIADNLTLNINSLRDIEEISIQKYYTDNIDFTLSKIGSVKTLIIGSHQFQSLISLQALFPKIQTLDLSDCDNITGCFEGKSLTNLVKINLGCTDISKADVEDLLKNAPNLQELNLSDCEDITGCFEGKSLTNLVKINLGGSKISKADVEDLLKNAPNLQELDLNYCKEITGCFERKSLTNLVKINLCRSKISKADVEDLLKNVPNLQELDLRGCRNITGCFEEVNLNSLMIIDLGSISISQTDLVSLLKNAPNLQELDLSCCNDITGCFKKKNLNN